MDIELPRERCWQLKAPRIRNCLERIGVKVLITERREVSWMWYTQRNDTNIINNCSDGINAIVERS